MGLTLVAVFTAALLLPGILAVRTFFAAAKTAEVEPSMPSLASAEGIALIGLASVVVHLLYSAALAICASYAPVGPIPLANPYLLFTDTRVGISAPATAFSLFFGFSLLCATALAFGYVAGLIGMKWADGDFLYGPLADVIRKSRGEDDFIVAYVLGKIGEDGRQIGYQGVLANLIRDSDRFPAKVVLTDASVFYLHFRPGGPERREMTDTIDSIALSAADWHNIAFRVFRFVGEPADQAPA